jgi:CBS domain-containing protein
VTSTLVSQLLSSDTIYSYRLSRRGVVIEEEQAPDNVMQTLRVSDAMSPVGVRVDPDVPITEVAMGLAGDRETIALVVDEDGELGGVITDTDVTRALSEGEEAATAFEVSTTDVQTIFPDQTLHEALALFAGRSMHALPVTLREQPLVPCGILRRSDITNAYASAIETRDARVRRGRLRRALSDDVRYLELRVERGSVLNGHRLSELELPENVILVTVRHDGATLIPRGHTRLIAGDRVTVIAASTAVDEIQSMFRPVSDGGDRPRWRLDRP